METLRERLDVTVALLQEIPGLQVHKPESTFYLFPNVTGLMARLGFDAVAQFADAALKNTGVSFLSARISGSPLPRRDGALHPFCVLGHRHTGDPRGAHPVQGMGCKRGRLSRRVATICRSGWYKWLPLSQR